MATLTAQTPVLATAAATDLEVVYSAADVAGDEFVNTAKEALHVKNDGASPVTVTVDSPNTCSFNVAANAAHDIAVIIPAGEERLIGPFSKVQFNDAEAKVQVSYSDVTSVTVAVLTVKS